MKKSVLSVLTLVGLVASFSGCGSNSSSSNVSTSDLKGNWISQCEVDETISDQDTFTFTDSVLTVRNVTYDNLTCNNIEADILFDITLNYNYVLGSNVTTTGNKQASEIDLTLTGFNLAEGQLAELPPVGSTEYSIIYKENNKLYSAIDSDTLDGSTSAKRPNTLDFTEALTSN
ncbi:MAG: hypothetical protein K0U47_07380 [Epsilonproteobacteria bacterium]|nr:hypothetical protein [Campylobacterota bacterium]